MRYVVTHPSETRPSLIVRTCPTIQDEEIERLRDDMFGAGCSNGLLFDTSRCTILRDTFASMSRDAIVVDPGDAATEKLLVNAGAGSLDERVRRWLEMMSSNWNTALQPTVAGPFIADIVPAVSGSLVQQAAG